MAYAAFLAGLAFTNGRVGCAHAIAHQLGRYGIPHGVLCAVLLPYVCEYNRLRRRSGLGKLRLPWGKRLRNLL
jgi:alcohol dehydrogenase